VYAVSGGRLLCYREVEDLSEPVVLELPRRGVDLFAVSGVSADSVLPEGSHGGFGGVAIPTGEECPPLYWWRTSLETREETVYLEPRLRKQFCRLTMTLPTTLDAHVIDKEQLTFTFEGSVCGYDAEMNPASGPFSFTPEVKWLPSDIIASPLGGGGSFFLRRTVSVRLPRQTDASLMLHVTRNGSLIRSFSVGSYIAASGFDWSAPDLPDLSLSLDFATWTLRLTPSASLTDVDHDLSI